MSRVARVLAPLVLLAGAASEGALAQEQGGADPGAPRIELIAPEGSVYAGQVVALGVRVRIGRTYVAEHLVQAFQTRLDLPVRAVAPWLEGTEQLVPVPPAPLEEGASLALNDSVVRAPLVHDDAHDDVVVEIVRRFRLEEPGALVLAAPELRFTAAAAFDDDVLRGRVPRDPHAARVTGTECRLDVRPLPESSRNALYTGAVGEFTLHADVTPRQLASGGTARIVLEIRGDGDLRAFDAPRIEESPTLHVAGVLDELRADRRVVTYDVVPRWGGRLALPLLGIHTFEPRRERYVTVLAEPLVLEVDGPPLPSAPPPPPHVTDAPDPTGTALLTGLVLGALGLGVVLLFRARRARRPAPGSDAAHEASALADARAAAGDDIADALVAYLAVRLRCAPAAVVGPELAARLERSGVDAALARETAALVEELVAARYGGAPPDDARARTDRALDALAAE